MAGIFRAGILTTIYSSLSSIIIIIVSNDDVGKALQLPNPATVGPK
jgi:hypothetical protein